MASPSDRAKIAILGAGIQGCAAALELARKGIRVDLFDRAPVMSAASRWNEGKIHLGFVYAADRTMETARTMIRGAARFVPFFRRIVGSEAMNTVAASVPFDYLVHRKSLVPPDAFHAHLEECLELCRLEFDQSNEPQWPGFLLNEIREIPVGNSYSDKEIAAAFATPEISLNIRRLAGLIQNAIHSNPLIRVYESCNLERIIRTGSRYDLLFKGQNEAQTYTQVVNCTWQERLKFDRQMGIEAPHPWIHRYKLGIHIRGGVKLPVPSFTIVLGAFGDFVNFGKGEYYLSWYPIGKIATSSGLLPTDENELLARTDFQKINSGIHEALCQIAPGLRELDLKNGGIETRGGHIVAWGIGDVDTLDTRLHERATIGVHSSNGYHSVNTGKLTTAAIHAELLAERVVRSLDGEQGSTL